MYNHLEIEKKYQLLWEKTHAFRTTNKFKKKFYVLDMFPYPSGSGLHVGHPEGYTATDIIARYKRLNNFDVLHPIGWDAFGLPAEQYAIQTGNHPEEFTKINIEKFKMQLKSLGFSFDYNKEINTTDSNYYKWTQWIFLQLYKNNLAEIKDIEVNWCQELGTVLANEEIIMDDKGKMVSERGSFLVIKKPMKQWVLKITNYAQKLFDGLEEVFWPESLKSLQKNWIFNEDGSLHLKDWVFSRQRYWGEPFPLMFNENGDVILIENLPVTLPFVKEIKPSGTGESPLANNKEWLNIEMGSQKFRRETNTMPQWAGSSWYFLAYILKNKNNYLDPRSKKAQKLFKKWLPVDLYIGGQEHAVLHLLYARFWHKVLFDLKIVPTSEPFLRVINQGMILGPDNQKMSKSRGNVINPDDIILEFGADTLRVYEMFMGPLEETKIWSSDSINGIYKWLERVERIYEIKLSKKDLKYQNADEKTLSNYFKLIKDITQNIEDLKFNVAISKMMVFINHLYKKESVVSKSILEGFAVILSLFAPHLAEELLFRLNVKPIKKQKWPTFDENKIIDQEIYLAVQVNGKLRATIEINKNEIEKEIIQKALSNENVLKFINHKKIIKTIYVPLKIINIIIEN